MSWWLGGNMQPTCITKAAIFFLLLFLPAHSASCSPLTTRRQTTCKRRFPNRRKTPPVPIYSLSFHVRKTEERVGQDCTNRWESGFESKVLVVTSRPHLTPPPSSFPRGLSSLCRIVFFKKRGYMLRNQRKAMIALLPQTHRHRLVCSVFCAFEFCREQSGSPVGNPGLKHR